MSTIIHIGMQKTGTTFLQKTLHENRDRLIKYNVLYQNPVAGLAGNQKDVQAHHWLAHALSGRRKQYTPTPEFKLIDEHVAALHKAAMLRPNAVSILSSEEFSELRGRAIARFRRFFPAKDTRILVYLRRQDLWLDSFYAQLVKVGRNTSPEELFEKKKWRLNYSGWLDTWADHFGTENIIVRVYEGFGPEKNIWDDFFTAINKPEASQVRPAINAVNQSLSYELTLFSKAQHIYGEQRSLRHLLDKVNGHFLQRTGLKYISESLAKKILATSADTNLNVAKKYLGRDRLFQDEVISSVAENESLSVEQLAQIVGGISIRLIGRISKMEKQIHDLDDMMAKAKVSNPLIYATRSLLPSETANSLQSSEMACSFDKIMPHFTAVYRSAAPIENPNSHFAPYGLTPPRRTHALRAPSPWLDWTHTDLPAFRALLRYQPRNTIVYTRSSRFSWVSVSSGLTTFIELHDPLTRIRTAWLRHLLETHRLPGIVTTTKRLKNDLLAALPSLRPDRVLVAGGAASAAFIELPPLTLPQARDFNVGYAGSAFRGKGLEIILACAARLPEIAFHVIGPGPTACAQRGSVSANVVFHGHKPHPEAIGLLKSMDALLLPNQRSVIIRSGADIGAHTSPLKLFEYLATGRPIIASNLPVFHDILRDGENALLAPPEDVDGFCRQLRRLQDDPSLGHSLGTQAQLDFAASHTWEHRARRIVEFMTQLAPLAA